MPAPRLATLPAGSAYAAIDVARVSLDVATVTGHAPLTFEHEACMQRVLDALERGASAWVRDEARAHTVIFTPAMYHARAVA